VNEKRNLVYEHDVEAQHHITVCLDNVVGHVSHQTANVLALLSDSLAFQRSKIGPECIFGGQDVGAGNGAILEHPTLDDLHKIMSGGTTNHVLDPASQLSLLDCTLGIFLFLPSNGMHKSSLVRMAAPIMQPT
jgi:hypothetical protein